MRKSYTASRLIWWNTDAKAKEPMGDASASVALCSEKRAEEPTAMHAYLDTILGVRVLPSNYHSTTM